MLVIRQWRALKTLMTNGKTTNAQLAKGELVVACPACPRPGFNIPDNWKLNPNRYGYDFCVGTTRTIITSHSQVANSCTASSSPATVTFTSNDAATKQELPYKTRSSEMRVSGHHRRCLTRMWRSLERTRLLLMTTCVITSLCCITADVVNQDGGCNANFKAGDPVRPSLTAWSSGHHFSLAATGIYGLSCRHVLLRSNGVTDFTKGEKYVRPRLGPKTSVDFACSQVRAC